MMHSLIKFKKQRKRIANIALLFAMLFYVFSPFMTFAAFPVISNVQSTGITTVSATITWTTDIASNSFVDYGLTTSYDNTRGNASSYVTDHSVTIDSLSPNTPYKFRVWSADSGGDQTTDDNGGVGFSFNTMAAPVISNVRIAEITNTSVTITWDTDINSYPYVAYGSTSSYGQLIGDEENLGTSHSMTIAGFSAGAVKHYQPRAKDIYGNFTYYGSDSTFTIGAPYLTSFTSSTSSGYYGPADEINITANYTDSAGNNLGASSTATVLLDTGVEVTLDTVGTNTLSGTYTVGGTGSGENSVDLRVSSIVSQNVCDTNNYCHTGLTMIAPQYNINWVKDIYVDTILPVFSNVSPASSASINSVTTSSDISYTLSEGLGSGTIVMTRTSGTSDPGSPHTCTLTGAALNSGAHNNFDTTTGCSGGAVTLVDGAVYDFDFDGQDPSGNNASQIARTDIAFDTSEPQLASFTSTTADGTYGPTSGINITATYGVGENLANGSSITITLNTGAQAVLSTIESGNKLTGTYTVGATGSGQNTGDLTVSTIDSQNAVDQAGNTQSGTSLPGTNIADGSAIVIDTTAPNAPSLVQFMTDPVINSNKANVTLRVDGEIGATILYSIDDYNNTFTNPATGSAIMEGDGSTDITGINLSGLDDGTLTATVTLRDPAMNESPSAEDTVTKDTTGPTFLVQYYSDTDLTLSMGDNPELKAGTYYLKITSNEGLVSTPTISIEAEGTGNDVLSAATTSVSGNDYKYVRTIATDAAAVGVTLENISLTGTDNFSNTSTNVNPTNEATKAAYTDTEKPVINTGSATPDNAKAGTVNVSLTFDYPMDQTVSPTVTITKSDLADLNVTGSYSNSTTWTGTASIVSGDANGTATLKASLAEDLAGNVMDANNNVDAFFIDTVNPAITVNDGTSATPVQSDTINVSDSDIGGSGVASQFYGYSADATCDAGDTIDTAFTSGVDFSITGDHSDYLCVRAVDNANNINYQTVGQLHVDNSDPTITNISSDHSNGSFRVGEVIDIDVTFSEAVTSTGDVTVTLETGTTDRSCTFTVSNSSTASCDYAVQDGDTSADLDVQSISGAIKDQALNDMTDFVPVTNLAANKAIIIDTTAPTVNITYPLSGNRVPDTAVITFSDDETTDPECSIDDSSWVNCTSGVTAMNSLTGWGALGEGNFTLYMRDTDLAENIGTDTEVGVIKDNSGPTITGIVSDHSNGNFKAGEIIDIDVEFSEYVTSTGDVTVTLETGAIDRSCSFTVTNATGGSCDYTVQDGDTSSDLAVLSVAGTIKDQAQNAMTNFVPAANLDVNKDIVIDTTAPTISNVNSDHADGTFSDPEVIDIDVTFSEAVTSTGLVTVTLDSGGSCTFSISNSNFGTCNYTVQPGNNSIDLDAFSISGTIKDQAQNAMTNFVPATNLAANKAIVIDTTPEGKPTITNVSSDHADGSFKASEIIDLDFTFSEAVTSTGLVTVTLDSGGSCTFTISNSLTGGCNYTVDAGENSSDLTVQSVSGIIKDQAQNMMTNYVPATNLADNKAIVIDTTAPDAPVVLLSPDPITDANKNSVTITGTGEADASVSYSIDDTDSGTSPITGNSSVIGGSIYIAGIDLGSLSGGTITATVTVTDAAGNESDAGIDTATSQVVKPTILNVTSDHADGTFNVREVIDIDFTFSEAVTSTGDVTVTLDSGGSCVFSVTNSDTATCDYTVQAGDDSLDLTVSGISGTINDQAQNAMTNFVPATNLAANKAIVIDTTGVVLESFSSTTANGAYGPTSNINITANYSEAIVSGATVTVVLDTGAEMTLSTITSGTKLTGTYTVGITGSGENSSDLAVESITSQNVCDSDNKCETRTSLPGTNISNGSNIAVDTAAPEFNNISPAGSTNINSVTANSGISYTLSEDLSSGSIVITRTAWEADPGSPHVCILTGQYLQEGAHSQFDTTNCQGGAVDLVVGAVYTFSFQGEDLNSNVSSEETRTGVTFGMDVNAPIISDVNISNITSSSAVITWTTDEASGSLVDFGTGLTYGTTMGNSEDSVTSHSVTIYDLDPGTSYKYRVRSADADGNESIADNSGAGYGFSTLTLAVNTEVAVTNITSSSAKLSWSSDSSAYPYVYYGTTEDYGMVLGNEETLTKDHSLTVAGLSANTKYYFRARTKDINGNFSLGSSGTFTTLEGTPEDTDTTTPSISRVNTSNGLNSSVVVTWRTNKDCNGMVRFGLDNNYGQSMAEDITVSDVANFTTTHEVILNNLLSNVTYHYSVVSYDAAGNIAVSGDDTFSTPSLSSISSVQVTDITLNSATIVWETGDPTTSEVEYGLTTSYGQKKTDSASVNMHKLQLTGLQPEKTYHFIVKGVNNDDNSIFSDDYIFATNAQPAIKSQSVEEVTDSTITVKWATNVETDSQLEFVNRNNPDEKGNQGLSDLSTEHRLTLNGLNQGSDYDLKIRGTDVNKNSFESDPFLVTTEMDRQAPEITQVSTQSSLITGKEDRVQSIITWKTDEIATSQVIFDSKKKSGEESSSQESKIDLNLSTNHVVVLTNLKPGSVYYFKVISKDKNENSAESEDFSLLTPQKKKSIIQLIIANFEQTFGWMNKMKIY